MVLGHQACFETVILATVLLVLRMVPGFLGKAATGDYFQPH